MAPGHRVLANLYIMLKIWTATRLGVEVSITRTETKPRSAMFSSTRVAFYRRRRKAQGRRFSPSDFLFLSNVPQAGVQVPPSNQVIDQIPFWPTILVVPPPPGTATHRRPESHSEESVVRLWPWSAPCV